ncbi:MAG TPA: acyl-CoA dehydrogenase [Steroidobacteraceae bacterium]|jgi:alkylation response protein AidB-like acyl-CoA dehydrogenase
MFQAPLKDLRFVLHDLLCVQELAELPRYGEFSGELADSVLEQAARFAEQVLAPINVLGDIRGARYVDGSVQMPAEFRSAYKQYVADGWPLLSTPPAHGGQGSPLVLAVAAEEIWFGANLAFMLCPQLSRGAVDALEAVATPALQAMLLPKLVSGEWTGTMNLTEPQAGSDLGAIRTRARPDGEHYRISGQKIFITYGEHDLADNIVHLMLARIDGAPAGVKGMSLFAVPKRLINADGSLGEINDVRCVSIEHKLGIHASPTCVMSYGDGGGALGYLVGEPHHGLEYMFIMMNAARLSVGVQGIGLSELALQQASQWAHSRVQGRPIAARIGAKGAAQSKSPALPIIAHPDVARMLLTIRANVEAMRALALYAALSLDRGRADTDAARAQAAQTRGELLIPIVKGWSTDLGAELASLAMQIHGGMGFIEETGVAQTLRDVRITSIYEGTTGIQANDLLGRKIGRDRGAAMAALLSDMLRELNDVRGSDAAMRSVRNLTIEAITVLRDATEALLYQYAETPARAYAVSVPYLHLCGRVLGGALMARSAAVAARKLTEGSDDDKFYRAKLQSARFYAEYLLPLSLSLARTIKSGGASVVDANSELI